MFLSIGGPRCLMNGDLCGRKADKNWTRRVGQRLEDQRSRPSSSRQLTVFDYKRDIDYGENVITGGNLKLEKNRHLWRGAIKLCKIRKKSNYCLLMDVDRSLPICSFYQLNQFRE